MTIISGLTLILFMYIFYIFFFENRYCWVSFENKTRQPYRKYVEILYTDKLKSGIQIEHIDNIHFTSFELKQHMKSKNIHNRRIKFIKYKD